MMKNFKVILFLLSFGIGFLIVSNVFATTCPLTIQDGSGATLTGYTIQGCENMVLSGGTNIGSITSSYTGSTTIEELKTWLKSPDFFGTLQVIYFGIFTVVMYGYVIYWAIKLGILITKPKIGNES